MTNEEKEKLNLNYCRRIVSYILDDKEDDLVLVYKDNSGWCDIPYDEDNLCSLLKKFNNGCIMRRNFLGKFLILVKKDFDNEAFELNELVGVCQKENLESMKTLMIEEYIEGNGKRESLEKTKRQLEELERKADELRKSIAEQTAGIDSYVSECADIEKNINGDKDMVKRCFVKFHYGRNNNTFDVKTAMVKETKGEKSMRIQQDNCTCYIEWIGECVESKLNECKVEMINACMKYIEDNAMKKDEKYEAYVKARDLRDSLLK